MRSSRLTIAVLSACVFSAPGLSAYSQQIVTNIQIVTNSTNAALTNAVSNVSTNSAAEPATNAPATDESVRVIADGPLYRLRWSFFGVSSRIKAGDRVAFVQQRRPSMFKVLLSDGRKGWIEPERLSAGPDETVEMTSAFELKQAPDFTAAGAGIAVNGKESARLLERKAGWVKVRLNDSREGWVSLRNAAYPGQLPDNAVGWLYFALVWLSAKLGGGFNSSIVMILLYILPSLLIYLAVKWLSKRLKFLHNWFLKLLIVLLTAALYYFTLMTVYYASPLAVSGLDERIAWIVLIFLSSVLNLALFRIYFHSIGLRRCPSCKAWKGHRLRKPAEDTSLQPAQAENGAPGKEKKPPEPDCVCKACGHQWKR